MEEIRLTSWGWYFIPLLTGFYIYIPVASQISGINSIQQEDSCHLLKLNFGMSFRETTVAQNNAQLYKTVIDVGIQ